MKLKATHLIDEGVYLVDNSSRLNLEVSGLKVDNRHFTVNSLDEIVWLKRPLAKIIHYSDVEGNTISVDGYNNESKKLLENADCLYGDPEFSNIDEEYAYKKFNQTWKAVYDDPQEERISAEIEVVEVRTNSGDPDIQSLWNSPNLNKDKKLYVFDRRIFAKKFFLEFCERCKVTPYIPSHGGLKYAKINNEYAFTNETEFEFVNSQFIGTLEQCKQAKVVLEQKIKKRVLLKVPKITEVKISNIGSVLNQLYSLRSSMSTVQPIQKTTIAYNNAKNTLGDIIKTLEVEIVAAAERL